MAEKILTCTQVFKLIIVAFLVADEHFWSLDFGWR